MCIFLHCSTDFYHHQQESFQKVGFQPGVANEVVQKMFQRYEKQTRYEEQAAKLQNIATSDSNIPSAIQEVVVSNEAGISGKSEIMPCTAKTNEGKDISEVYNGDDRGTHRWSQTVQDIDVFIPVPKDIQKAKQLKVKIDPLHLKVEMLQHDASHILIDQDFPHKVTSDECIWSLVVGEHIQVNNGVINHFLLINFEHSASRSI